MPSLECHVTVRLSLCIFKTNTDMHLTHTGHVMLLLRLCDAITYTVCTLIVLIKMALKGSAWENHSSYNM